MKRPLFGMCGLLLVLALVVPAAASTALGTKGKVTYLDSPVKGSTYWASFHGAVIIAGAIYNWGGSPCPNISKPSANQVKQLFQALIYKLDVHPTYQTGSGSTRCLVRMSFYPTP